MLKFKDAVEKAVQQENGPKTAATDNRDPAEGSLAES